MHLEKAQLWLLVAALPLVLGAADGPGANETSVIDRDDRVTVSPGGPEGHETGIRAEVRVTYSDSDEHHNGRRIDQSQWVSVIILGTELPAGGHGGSADMSCSSRLKDCEAVDEVVGHESREPKGPPPKDREPEDYIEDVKSFAHPSTVLTDDNCGLVPVDACDPVIETWDDAAPEFPVDLTN